ncbi:MAG: hypothetical protein KBD37_04305 [Burkholderiales bacterium]|nr:hypothetical protein [Burkholderiales bacterium]
MRVNHLSHTGVQSPQTANKNSSKQSHSESLSIDLDKIITVIQHPAMLEQDFVTVKDLFDNFIIKLRLVDEKFLNTHEGQMLIIKADKLYKALIVNIPGKNYLYKNLLCEVLKLKILISGDRLQELIQKLTHKQSSDLLENLTSSLAELVEYIKEFEQNGGMLSRLDGGDKILGRLFGIIKKFEMSAMKPIKSFIFMNLKDNNQFSFGLFNSIKTWTIYKEMELSFNSNLSYPYSHVTYYKMNIDSNSYDKTTSYVEAIKKRLNAILYNDILQSIHNNYLSLTLYMEICSTLADIKTKSELYKYTALENADQFHKFLASIPTSIIPGRSFQHRRAYLSLLIRVAQQVLPTTDAIIKVTIPQLIKDAKTADLVEKIQINKINSNRSSFKIILPQTIGGVSETNTFIIGNSYLSQGGVSESTGYAPLTSTTAMLSNFDDISDKDL